MPVEGDRLRAGVVHVLLGAKDLRALRVKQSFGDEVVDRPAGREHRIQRQPRLWPLLALSQFILNVLVNPRIERDDGAGRERAIVID